MSVTVPLDIFRLVSASLGVCACSHLCPNIRVDLVSASLKEEGEQQMTMVVLQLPPKES